MLRTLVVSKPTTLKALSASLAADSGGASAETAAANLSALGRLNPHVADLDRVPAGTVVFVPAGSKSRGDGESIVEQSFGQFSEHVRQAVEASAKRVDAGHAALAEQQKEVVAALRSAAVKRQIDADADLQQQVKDAEAVFKADQQAARTAEQAFETLPKDVAAELAALAKLFD